MRLKQSDSSLNTVIDDFDLYFYHKHCYNFLGYSIFISDLSFLTDLANFSKVKL